MTICLLVMNQPNDARRRMESNAFRARAGFLRQAVWLTMVIMASRFPSAKPAPMENSGRSQTVTTPTRGSTANSRSPALWGTPPLPREIPPFTERGSHYKRAGQRGVVFFIIHDPFVYLFQKYPTNLNKYLFQKYY